MACSRRGRGRGVRWATLGGGGPATLVWEGMIAGSRTTIGRRARVRGSGRVTPSRPGPTRARSTTTTTRTTIIIRTTAHLLPLLSRDTPPITPTTRIFPTSCLRYRAWLLGSPSCSAVLEETVRALLVPLRATSGVAVGPRAGRIPRRILEATTALTAARSRRSRLTTSSPLLTGCSTLATTRTGLTLPPTMAAFRRCASSSVTTPSSLSRRRG